MSYSGVHYGPKVRPWIAPDTEWAPTAPYYGDELAYLTSMTPFRKADFVPVNQQGGVPEYISFDWGGTDWKSWLSDTVANIGGATGIKVGLRSGVGPNDPAVAKLQEGLVLLGYSNLLGSPAVDGSFGPRTASAVRAFQVSKGLPSTGVVDDETAKALNRAIALKKSIAAIPSEFPSSAPVSTAPPVVVPQTSAFGAPAGGIGLGGKIALTVVAGGLLIYALAR